MTADASPSAAAEMAEREPRRWLKVLLVASLAVNLLVVGAAATAMIGLHRGVGLFARPIAGPPNLLGFLKTLPRDRRDAIWQATAPDRKLLSPLRKEYHRLRDDMHRTLIREPFDKEQFAAAMKALDEAEGRLRQSAQGLVASVAANLTAEERHAYVKWQSRFRRHNRRAISKSRDSTGATHEATDASATTTAPKN
jgi:uncharacterized membrane protein